MNETIQDAASASEHMQTLYESSYGGFCICVGTDTTLEPGYTVGVEVPILSALQSTTFCWPLIKEVFILHLINSL